ncbi:hypothetical protein KC19_11G116000 [Ceratodon purpureus]|uniref:Mediator complex subunit 15 KIX domain-containing protein n=1 Tax=Ceratodon purpureus TaxID=3225 RepID=A0A8T0GF22_CERPU|nr:hypothetical protein KC19_11G116000 [Ceratodon purpureus]
MDNSWRSNLSHESRNKIVNRILANLQRHMPAPPGQDGVDELIRVARRFEEKIFQVANDQNDYLRKISLKLMSLDTVSKGRNPLITGATSTNLGEIEEENFVNMDVSVPPPETAIPFVEVLGPDGMKKRFAQGTRAGFVVDRFNKLNPNDSKPVVCIQAHKEGEEPIEYGPEVELQVLHDKSWTLQSVSEYAFPILHSDESSQSKKVCLRHPKSEGVLV